MISKYSVKRPYTVLVAVVLVIVLGAVSLSKMTTDLLPDMSFQYAMVVTTDMGASPEQVESDVTAPIESAMATTSNIKNISSVSYNSYSVVTLEYEQNANMDSVVIEIQQSLDQVSGQWDDSIGTPMIMKVNPDMMPVLAAAVDKDGMDANALSDYVKNDLAPALESLEGVASVTTTGQLEESVDVTLDQDKIDALNKKIQKKIDEQFEKSQKKIDAGKKKVESGKSSISQGSEQLNSAINQTMDQQKKLYKTEQDLKKQLAELKKQKASLEQIQTGIQTFMKSDAYTGIVTVLKDNPQLAESSEMQAQIKQVNAVVKKQFSALSSLGITVNTYEDLPAASAEVGKLLTKVNTGMKTIERAQQKVESGKVSLASALDTLNANASMTALQVSASSTELANAASSLESAQSKLDEAKDTAYDSADLNKVLSKDTITSLLAAQNFDMPAGYAMDGDTEYLVRVGDAVQDVSELKDLPLVDMGIDGIDTIRLSDVAEIKVTDNSDETYAVINGNPGIMLSMEKQTGYSTGEVTNRILDKFKALEKEDSKLHLNVLMNQGVYIDMIVNSVMQNMIWGAILAILVLLLFLKDIKPTIVIACFRCRCNRADVLYRNYLKYYFHVRTDAWYWYACGQLNCCHRKYLSSARRRLFHPESSGRRIKTGDGCDHCVNAYHDQRLCADYFYRGNYPAAVCGSCPDDCIYPGSESGRGIDVCPGDGFCYTQKNKRYPSSVVRCRPGMVWQSAGVVSAFQTTGTDYCGGSSDRKCSTVTFKRLKLYGYGYGDKSAFRHDFCKRG